ncbi:MAG: VWA domain-containing protein [Desulfobacteraceae bacterium]|nr:VWA domain-containing protein [Desulfobacteraceae bacterium]
MSFCGMVGHKDAKLALILNLIDPGIGGVLLIGDKGTGKSALARSVAALLPARMPYVEVPLNVTEDALLGGVDLDEAVRTGRRIFHPGLLARAQGGMLYVDEINLLNIDIVNLILSNRSLGPGFTLVASMNPEEGPISPKLIDHFGLCALFETSRDLETKCRVLRRAGQECAGANRFARFDLILKRRIVLAGESLKQVVMPAELRAEVVDACLQTGVEGHRGDISLERSARSYAAFCGAITVTAKHLERVLPLALIHRRRDAASPEEEHARREPEPHDREGENRREPPDSSGSETQDRTSGDGSAETALKPQPREGRPKEEVFQVGDAFDVRRLLFARDRLERRSSGRRTNSRFSGKGGRYVKSMLRSKARDIAVDATLRAAAPWQIARGRTGNVIVRDEDVRFKQREKKMGHLVIFVVDCSGSMGAKKRMIETKGAVLSLLMDCYHKRDKVALIAFRKDRAEIVLPPTTSVDLAARKLRDIPVGGKTPLAAALITTHNLMRQVRIKEPQLRFIVAIVSDARANQAVSDLPVREEVAKSAGILRDIGNADFVVVDTEDKSNFMRMDLARNLALDLDADYFTTVDLKAEYLAGLLSSRKQ